MGIDKKHYAEAAIEVSNGHLDPALYLKALTIADGDDKKAKAVYIGLRAEELQSETRKATVARAVGGAAGVTVGTAQAAAVVAKNLPFRKLFSLFAGIAAAWVAFAISLGVAGSIMSGMQYDMDYPGNIAILVIGSGAFALVVGRVTVKSIWPTRPSA